MNGWSTELAIWEEVSPLGAQTGTAYRPPGIVQVNIQPRVVQRWQVIDPLRAIKTDDTLQRAWSVTISRQFDRSLFSSFWLNSITDTTPTIVAYTIGIVDYETQYRNLIDNPVPRTFGMEFITEDGNQRRVSGMAVQKIEYTIQSGRIVSEEVTLAAIKSEEFSGAVRSYVVESHVVHSALLATFNLQVGTVWSGSHSAYRQTTFSSQLIFQRDLEPSQFDSTGTATRFAVNGGWEFLGRIICRSPALWQQLHNATACLVQWTIGTNANYVDFQANAKVRLSSHAVLVNGQIDTNLDFQAYRFGRSLINLIKRSQT